MSSDTAYVRILKIDESTHTVWWESANSPWVDEGGDAGFETFHGAATALLPSFSVIRGGKEVSPKSIDKIRDRVEDCAEEDEIWKLVRSNEVLARREKYQADELEAELEDMNAHEAAWLFGNTALQKTVFRFSSSYSFLKAGDVFGTVGYDDDSLDEEDPGSEGDEDEVEVQKAKITTPKATKSKGASNADLTGKVVALTGTFARAKRGHLESQLKSLGATVAGSITKKTEILFAGSDAGSKLDKARADGIIVRSENDLYKLLDM